MALDKFRDPADPVWEQRITQLEKAEGVGEITVAKLPEVTGSKIAPAVLANRLIQCQNFVVPAATKAELYLPTAVSGAVVKASAATEGTIEYGALGVPELWLIPSLYEVTGRTLKLQLEGLLLNNAASATGEITVGICKAASTEGGAAKNVVKWAALETEPQIKLTPGANATDNKRVTVAFPATGIYSVAIKPSVETAASSQLSIQTNVYAVYS